MSTTAPKIKFHLLGLLVALVVGGGVLLLVPEPPDAQAQLFPPPPPPNVVKDCFPNPVQRGQQLTCVIEVTAIPSKVAFVQVTDPFPAALEVTGATYVVLDFPLPP